jgi:hypothetical protein
MGEGPHLVIPTGSAMMPPPKSYERTEYENRFSGVSSQKNTIIIFFSVYNNARVPDCWDSETYFKPSVRDKISKALVQLLTEQGDRLKTMTFAGLTLRLCHIHTAERGASLLHDNHFRRQTSQEEDQRYISFLEIIIIIIIIEWI